MTKKSVYRASYLRHRTSCDCHLWYTCVKWWHLQEFFFSSFQNFNVLGYHGAKAVKNMVQIDKHILSIAPLIFDSWAESWVSWLNLVYLENHSLNPENPQPRKPSSAGFVNIFYVSLSWVHWVVKNFKLGLAELAGFGKHKGGF